MNKKMKLKRASSLLYSFLQIFMIIVESWICFWQLNKVTKCVRVFCVCVGWCARVCLHGFVLFIKKSPCRWISYSSTCHSFVLQRQKHNTQRRSRSIAIFMINVSWHARHRLTLKLCMIWLWSRTQQSTWRCLSALLFLSWNLSSSFSSAVKVIGRYVWWQMEFI